METKQCGLLLYSTRKVDEWCASGKLGLRWQLRARLNKMASHGVPNVHYIQASQRSSNSASYTTRVRSQEKSSCRREFDLQQEEAE